MSIFTVEQFVALTTMGILLLSVVGGLVKWLVSRMDRVSNTAARAHGRIDELPKTYIMRDETMGHFNRIEASLEAARIETTTRLDRLYELLLKQGNNHE